MQLGVQLFGDQAVLVPELVTRRSEMRAMTGRVGLVQSEGKIGSHTTRTVKLSDFSCFNTCSATEAPRRQPGQVGDKRSSSRMFEASALNWPTNGLSLVKRVSGGCPLGVIADHKKYQASVSTTAKPRSHVKHLLLPSAVLRLASNEAGDELRKQGHEDYDDNSSPEHHQTGCAPLYAGFPRIELH